jgi:hypothetical protein
MENKNIKIAEPITPKFRYSDAIMFVAPKGEFRHVLISPKLIINSALLEKIEDGIKFNIDDRKLYGILNR